MGFTVQHFHGVCGDLDLNAFGWIGRRGWIVHGLSEALIILFSLADWIPETLASTLCFSGIAFMTGLRSGQLGDDNESLQALTRIE